jgi:Thiol-disulfide isomerase and thioredoxins
MTNLTKMMAVALAVCLSLAAAAPARAQVGISVGAKAPGAVVHTLDGGQLNLDQYIGKTPVLLEFWATWCGNCKELEPQFLKVSKQYGSRVKFVGVAVSVNQSPRRVKLYAEKYHYPYQMVYDTDGNAVVAYDVPATSYVVVIDKSGKVVYTGLGGDQNLDAAIRKAL